ncbi:MAG: hypothetical protein EOO63_06895 [Hymenobacter sp.]|nr:MAG: hypothetical protein EOO63_06895 [Hymenobacter sp.]
MRMLNPQIVNGGQTSHALFEAARADLNRIYDVKLLIRVIETGDRGFTNSVAEATNSQTPIRSRDIRSNDSIQLKIENSLIGHGYFYERKNDQHIDQAADKRVDAVKLGQVILAYVLREPDRAKTSSQKLCDPDKSISLRQELYTHTYSRRVATNHLLSSCGSQCSLCCSFRRRAY